MFKANGKMQNERINFVIPAGVFDAVMEERNMRYAMDMDKMSTKKKKEMTKKSIAFSSMMWGEFAKSRPAAGCAGCGGRGKKLDMRCDMYVDPAFHHYIFWPVCSQECGLLCSGIITKMIQQTVQKKPEPQEQEEPHKEEEAEMKNE